MERRSLDVPAGYDHNASVVINGCLGWRFAYVLFFDRLDEMREYVYWLFIRYPGLRGKSELDMMRSLCPYDHRTAYLLHPLCLLLTPAKELGNWLGSAREGPDHVQEPRHVRHSTEDFHMVMNGLDSRMVCATLQVAESLAGAHLTHEIEREEHRPIGNINGSACATVHLSHGQVSFGFDTGFVAR